MSVYNECMNGKRRILFLSASPASYVHLALDKELREVDARIRAALPADRFEIIVAAAAQRAELTHLIVAHRPDIVHFSGHGDRKRGIIFEDERGNPAPVNGKALAALFSIVRGKPNIVVLNACSTKRTARAFQHIVDYTIAMNGPIRDISAVAFANAFYDAFGRGLPVPAAFGAGLAQLLVLKLPSKHTPELFIAPGTLMPIDDQTGREASADPIVAGISMRGNVVRGEVVIVSDHSTYIGKRVRR